MRGSTVPDRPKGALCPILHPSIPAQARSPEATIHPLTAGRTQQHEQASVLLTRSHWWMEGLLGQMVSVHLAVLPEDQNISGMPPSDQYGSRSILLRTSTCRYGTKTKPASWMSFILHFQTCHR